MGICPYCKDSVSPAEAVYCPSCEAPHHIECWTSNQDRCSVYGCESRQEDRWLGCPWCDEFYPAERKICMLCNMPLMTIEDFRNFVEEHDWVSLGPDYASAAPLVTGYLRNQGVMARISKKAPISMFGIAGQQSVLVLPEHKDWAMKLIRELYERSRNCDQCGHVLFQGEESCSYCTEEVSI